MKFKNRISFGLVAVCCLFLAGGCNRQADKLSVPVSEKHHKTHNEQTVSSQTIMSEPPAISLSDTLSNATNEFTVQSSSYEWNGLVSCGMAPWDYAYQKSIYLTIPAYHEMDGAPYQLQCELKPDSVLVREWDIAGIDSGDPEMLSCKEYEENELIKLKAGRIYEIVLKWEQENYAGNDASYIILTDKE